MERPVLLVKYVSMPGSHLKHELFTIHQGQGEREQRQREGNEVPVTKVAHCHVMGISALARMASRLLLFFKKTRMTEERLKGRINAIERRVKDV